MSNHRRFGNTFIALFALVCLGVIVAGMMGALPGANAQTAAEAVSVSKGTPPDPGQPFYRGTDPSPRDMPFLGAKLTAISFTMTDGTRCVAAARSNSAGVALSCDFKLAD